MSISISYYVVKKGITPGIYRTWNDCNDQIKDYPSPSYKKFDNVIEAYKFLASDDKIELHQETIQNEKGKEKETFYSLTTSCQSEDNIETNFALMIKCIESFEIN